MTRRSFFTAVLAFVVALLTPQRWIKAIVLANPNGFPLLGKRRAPLWQPYNSNQPVDSVTRTYHRWRITVNQDSEVVAIFGPEAIERSEARDG